jgi:hypothetical protein
LDHLALTKAKSGRENTIFSLLIKQNLTLVIGEVKVVTQALRFLDKYIIFYFKTQ